jgi:hypothetical protein
LKRKLTVFILFYVLAVLIVSCGRITASNSNDKTDLQETTAKDAAQIRVDIYYLPHPPAMKILKKAEAVLRKFPAVKTSEYDFTDPKNAGRIEAQGLTGHSPIIILINDKSTFMIEGRQVEFKNFPKGDAFIPTLEGSWTFDDLEKVLGTE